MRVRMRGKMAVFTDICTSTCYMTNMYQLHKLDLDNKVPRSFAVLFLLLLSSDIVTDLGPTGESMFPWAVFQYGVNWSHKAVTCDNCSVWIHKTCASMDSVTYDQVENMSGRFYGCRMINVSSSVYNTYNLNVINSFEPLVGIPGDSSVFFTILHHQLIASSLQLLWTIWGQQWLMPTVLVARRLKLQSYATLHKWTYSSFWRPSWMPQKTHLSFFRKTMGQ